MNKIYRYKKPVYKIYRYNKRFNNITFETYEQARQYVRKWIRKNFVCLSNPSIGIFRFEIRTR